MIKLISLVREIRGSVVLGANKIIAIFYPKKNEGKSYDKEKF